MPVVLELGEICVRFREVPTLMTFQSQAPSGNFVTLAKGLYLSTKTVEVFGVAQHQLSLVVTDQRYFSALQQAFPQVSRNWNQG